MDSSPEVMLTYYRRLYPFKPIYHWLNHQIAPSRFFTHREFAFTLPGDVYLRYNSFNNADELKNQVCHLNPTRFEIGPVYSARPRDRKTVRSGAFVPQLRELVFDIDMTDYNSIRTCCSDADICKRCWGFISAAVHVLDSALRNDFGYQKLLWVYSGRRGIHLWISDEDAMNLTDQQRKVLVGWLTVQQPGKEANKKLNIRTAGKLPFSLQNALNYLNTIFGSLILTDQNSFQSESGSEELLSIIPDSQIVESLRKKWKASPSRTSEEKWSDLHKACSLQKSLLEDVIIQYTYPRIDAEVSKHRNHLLKAPFCIHPKTGRVCVPLDVDSIALFDPASVPTVAQLMQELDAQVIRDDQSRGNDWENTSLKPYIEIMNKHAMGLVKEKRGEKREPDISW